MINYIDEIEKVMSKKLDVRGMHKIRLRSDLENTAKDLNVSDNVVIVTGFCIRDCKIGETDGPLGALSLAYTLEKLNKKVIIITDGYTERLIKLSKYLINFQGEIFTVTHENSEELCNKIINNFNPNHIIAIERPGRNKDGKSYSMRGEDITELCPNTDILFKKAKDFGIRTSAIGDGGNEVGMGKISEYVIENVYKGEQICAEVETDNLIVAGISNWGSYAVSALLSVMNDKMLMYDYFTEVEILKKIVELGAVDGCTKQNIMTVDGVSFEEYIAVFNEIRNIVENTLKNLSTEYDTVTA